MEDTSPWRLIKAGFWLGIGFIVPSMAIYLLATLVVVGSAAWMFKSTTEDFGSMDEVEIPDMVSDYDHTDEVSLGEYRVVRNGSQTQVLGSVTNDGEQDVTTIEIEAEFHDAEGAFVYECSEYISSRLAPSQTENFRISCGCGDNPLPEYENLTVRVVRATSY